MNRGLSKNRSVLKGFILVVSPVRMSFKETVRTIWSQEKDKVCTLTGGEVYPLG